MSTSEQVNFVFRHQPKRRSKYGVLLTYICEDDAEMTRSERILHPVAAFWLPFAYKHCSDASLSEVQQMARSAIYQLKLHIQYLEDSFSLNSPVVPSEVARTEDREFSTNGKENLERFLDLEDFTQEDDILNQFT
jgi:hypothetical protein